PSEGLPTAVLEALRLEDWTAVRAELSMILDGQTTDGVYGRALIQVAMELPIGVDPLFDRYRAAAAIDHGDWDTLRRCIASNPIAPAELLGVRDLLLAPVDQTSLPAALLNPPQVMFFSPYEHELNQMSRRFRH